MQQSLPASTDATEQEYRMIEQALLETARGRWFLAEHGRRARRLDSALLEDAIGRLQSSIRQPPALLGQLQAELNSLKADLAGTRAAVLSRPGSTQPGSNEPPATAAKTDADNAIQPQAILKAAEDIHDIAWNLQANPFDPKGLEQIARNAGRLYVLSQSQAIESGRALAIAASLDDAAQRLEAILETVLHELQIDVSDSR